MRLRLRISLSVLTILGVAATSLPLAPATARHNRDEHRNMVYRGTSVKRGITNSDLAFWGDRAYAGNYNGFRIIDISRPADIANPARVITDFSCPGPQNDISVWSNDGDAAADLLFLSVDSPRSDDTCASTGTAASNPASWEGVRIFDINDERNPRLITSVPTDCGSHTHTLVPAVGDFLYIYVSSYPLGAVAVTNDIPADPAATPPRAAGVRNNGTECREPEGASTAVHNKISIIRVPLNNPAAASQRTPAQTGWTYANVKEVPLDSATRWTHYSSGGRSFDFTGCHDIAVFLQIRRAAAACWEEGQYWDIADPFSPRFLRRIRNDAVDSLFHSATFSWDGRIVAFEDEAGGGGAPRCEDVEDLQGRMWFYNLSARLLGHFKIPRPQPAEQACTAHNYNVIPLRNGRDVLASAWYEGGTSVIDFTNPRRAREVAFYDANSPVNGTGPAVRSDVWSSYWYNGFIYANDGLCRTTACDQDPNGERGLDVFSLTTRLAASAQRLPFLNPQTQHGLIGARRRGRPAARR